MAITDRVPSSDTDLRSPPVDVTDLVGTIEAIKRYFRRITSFVTDSSAHLIGTDRYGTRARYRLIHRRDRMEGTRKPTEYCYRSVPFDGTIFRFTIPSPTETGDGYYRGMSVIATDCFEQLPGRLPIRRPPRPTDGELRRRDRLEHVRYRPHSGVTNPFYRAAVFSFRRRFGTRHGEDGGR